MKRYMLALLAGFALTLPVMAENDTSTREERNLIVDGNKLYRDQRFADAEVAYRKAIQENPYSEIARFNLAAALLRQASADGKSQQEATQILNSLASDAADVTIAEKAFYNLGNLAFNAQQYQQSIDHYKNALRRNPDNDKARENLRLAQKRLEQQQNQDQNQDKNQDRQQDKQNQDQNKDQNEDRNKDQNQDQNNQNKNQDQNQNQDQSPQQQDKEPSKQNQPQQQGSMSKENAEKILKAMENEEAKTRRRIQAAEKKKGNASRKTVQNPW